MKSRLSIFDYRDYRKFLKEWYEEAKKNRRGFSFRSFSKKAGFGSPNFLKRVMEGERNLTDDSQDKCALALELNKQERDFFKKLVHFNQVEMLDQKNILYRELLRSKKLSQLKPMEKDQYDYYSTWYHAVIRELIVSRDFDGTPEWIFNRFHSQLTVAQIEKSIELLQRLGFIQKKRGGKWQQSTPLVTTGPEATSLVLLNYHQNLLELIKNQLPIISPEKRDVSALTLGLSRSKIPLLKKKLQEFRQEILKLVADETEPEEVVILSLQLMPMT